MWSRLKTHHLIPLIIVHEVFPPEQTAARPRAFFSRFKIGPFICTTLSNSKTHFVLLECLLVPSSNLCLLVLLRPNLRRRHIVLNANWNPPHRAHPALTWVLFSEEEIERVIFPASFLPHSSAESAKTPHFPPLSGISFTRDLLSSLVRIPRRGYFAHHLQGGHAFFRK